MSRIARFACLFLVSALGAGCASWYSPRDVVPGMDEAAVAGLMGKPTGRYPGEAGGTRLEYARGPAGMHTYMIDLDPAGRVVRWQQVLTHENFDAIQPGTPVEEVRRRIGRPSQVRGGGRMSDQVWSYSFADNQCQWWQVDITGGRTGAAGYSLDPRCAAGVTPRVD